jgi:hypothetical protein
MVGSSSNSGRREAPDKGMCWGNRLNKEQDPSPDSELLPAFLPSPD